MEKHLKKGDLLLIVTSLIKMVFLYYVCLPQEKNWKKGRFVGEIVKQKAWSALTKSKCHTLPCSLTTYENALILL